MHRIKTTRDRVHQQYSFTKIADRSDNPLYACYLTRISLDCKWQSVHRISGEVRACERVHITFETDGVQLSFILVHRAHQWCL